MERLTASSTVTDVSSRILFSLDLFESKSEEIAQAEQPEVMRGHKGSTWGPAPEVRPKAAGLKNFPHPPKKMILFPYSQSPIPIHPVGMVYGNTRVLARRRQNTIGATILNPSGDSCHSPRLSSFVPVIAANIFFQSELLPAPRVSQKKSSTWSFT